MALLSKRLWIYTTTRDTTLRTLDDGRLQPIGTANNWPKALADDGFAGSAELGGRLRHPKPSVLTEVLGFCSATRSGLASEPDETPRSAVSEYPRQFNRRPDASRLRTHGSGP